MSTREICPAFVVVDEETSGLSNKYISKLYDFMKKVITFICDIMVNYLTAYAVSLLQNT
jgi:hypothetical protein